MQRRLALYLASLWGTPIAVRQATDAGARTPAPPVVRDGAVFLPEALDEVRTDSPLGALRAAAVHGAAHLIYPAEPITGRTFRPRQQALIGLMEDARVEHLVLLRFPRLRDVWVELHCSGGASSRPGFAGLFHNLSLALVRDERDHGHFWIRKAVGLFHENRHRWTDPGLSRELGLALAHDVGQMRLPMNDRESVPHPPYRDDNRHLWLQEHALSMVLSDDTGADDSDADGVQLREQEGGRASAVAGRVRDDSRREGLRPEPVNRPAALRYADRPAPTQAGDCLQYPEWDYRIGRERRSWCSVIERPAWPTVEGLAEARLAAHEGIARHMEQVARARRSSMRCRQRRRESGDEIDLDAAIEAAADLRRGLTPRAGLYVDTNGRRRSELAVLVLLDLSESVNDPLAGPGRTVLGAVRDAALLLGQTMERVGDRFAIHSFSSNTRHAVAYRRLKDFHEPFDGQVRGRLAGMRAEHSTRLGAAIRHAAAILAAQPQHRRLLLVVTDGEPSDVDVFDPRYLARDVRHAVHSVGRQGIGTFCVAPDRLHAGKATAMFGPGRFSILKDLSRLPEALIRAYVGLAYR